MFIAEGEMTVKEDGDAVSAESAVGVTRDQVPAVASQELADVSSPAAAVTYPMTLFAQDAGVSHISLSTLKSGGRWENSYVLLSYFGGPANSESPVALRPSLTEGLPFRLLLGATMTV
jgi:hypothetical protein